MEVMLFLVQTFMNEIVKPFCILWIVRGGNVMKYYFIYFISDIYVKLSGPV